MSVLGRLMTSRPVVISALLRVAGITVGVLGLAVGILIAAEDVHSVRDYLNVTGILVTSAAFVFYGVTGRSRLVRRSRQNSE
jgi:cytochrome c biogenesis protein CcdA